MKANRHSAIPLFIFSCLFLYSCSEKKEDLFPTSSINSVSVDEGRLIFSNKVELNNFIIEGKKIGYDKFKNKLLSYQNKGFESLMPVFDKSDNKRAEDYANFRIKQK